MDHALRINDLQFDGNAVGKPEAPSASRLAACLLPVPWVTRAAVEAYNELATRHRKSRVFG